MYHFIPQAVKWELILMELIISRPKNTLQYILSSYWDVTEELGGGTKETGTPCLYLNRKETGHSEKDKNKIIHKETWVQEN